MTAVLSIIARDAAVAGAVFLVVKYYDPCIKNWLDGIKKLCG